MLKSKNTIIFDFSPVENDSKNIYRNYEVQIKLDG